MRSARILQVFATAAWIACLAGPAARASQVRPLNLEQMTERAARIFAGRCLETRVEHDPQLGQEVTLATFEVERIAKGVPGETITVRMIGGAESGRGPTAGLPQFRAGEDVVLFLYGESALGLSSPVGLGQGRFSVVTDKQGRRIAINDLANANLLRDLSPHARTRLGPAVDVWKERKDLDRAALLDLVDALVTGAAPQP